MARFELKLPDDWAAKLEAAGLLPSRNEGGLGGLVRRLLVEYANTHSIKLVDDTKPVGVRDDYRRQQLETELEIVINGIARLNARVADVDVAADTARKRGAPEEFIVATIEEYEGDLSRLLHDLYAEKARLEAELGALDV